MAIYRFEHSELFVISYPELMDFRIADYPRHLHHLISETVIKHRDRTEATRVENFPYGAIEQAVVNSVYHRGYDMREPIEVRIEHSRPRFPH